MPRPIAHVRIGFFTTMVPLCYLVFGGIAAFGSEDRQEILALLRAGNLGGREAIRTLSANMITEQSTNDKDKRVTFRTAYWRDGQRERCKVTLDNGAVEDCLRTPTDYRQFGTHPSGVGKRPLTGAVRESPSKTFMMGDPWRAMLMSMYLPESGIMDLERFLERLTSPPKLTWSRLDGRKCILLTTDYADPRLGSVRQEFWFDPDANYLARKQTMSYDNLRSEGVVEEFLRPAEGVVFPVKTRSQTTIGGKPGPVMRSTLSNVVVNQPIDQALFRLSVPHGTNVFDHAKNTRYAVDSEWNPISKPVPTPVDRTKGPKSEVPPSPYTQQSESEPPPGVNWLLWGSVGLLLTGGAAWAYRSSRPEKSESAK